MDVLSAPLERYVLYLPRRIPPSHDTPSSAAPLFIVSSPFLPMKWIT